MRNDVNRRASVEVQFNWIFVLIIGVIILLFFVGVAQWYRGAKEKEIAHSVVSKLQTILTGAEVSEQTASQIDLPRIELMFSCDPRQCGPEGCTSYFEFEDTGISQDTPADIIFTQSRITTDFVNAWSLPWGMPYKAANMLYLSTPDVQYYLVHDDDSKDFARQVYSVMGENNFTRAGLVRKEDVAGLEYRGEYIVRFVFFFVPADDVPVSASMKKGRWDVIFVDNSRKEVMYSKVQGGMRVKDEQKQFPFLGVSGVIGAIHAEDFGLYVCNMKKAFIKLRTVTEVYRLRTELLHDYYLGDGVCEYYYDTETQDQFRAIQDAVSDLDSPDMAAIIEAARLIEEYNSQATRRDCADIY